MNNDGLLVVINLMGHHVAQLEEKVAALEADKARLAGLLAMAQQHINAQGPDLTIGEPLQEKGV